MNAPYVVTIEKVSKHPNAAKLKICTVNDGNENYSVVCGASNVREGMKSIFAPVGSTTPRGVKIEKANLRGIDSFGMLCSAKDLNISDEAGIVDLPPHIKEGSAFDQIDPSFLSSIPWYTYKEVDSFWETPSEEILIGQQDATKGKLLSKTYFHDGKYLYRHFN